MVDIVCNLFFKGITSSITSFVVLKGLGILTNKLNNRLFNPKNYEFEEEILNYFIYISIADEIKEFFWEEHNEEELATRYVADKFNIAEIVKGKGTKVIGEVIKNILNKKGILICLNNI